MGLCVKGISKKDRNLRRGGNVWWTIPEIRKKVWDQQEICGGYLADFMTISCIKWMIFFLFTNSCKLDLFALSNTLSIFEKKKPKLRGTNAMILFKLWLLIFAQYMIFDIMWNKKEQDVCIDTYCIRLFMRNHSTATSPESSESLSN